MITIEVKVDGSTNHKTATYEAIWLDWGRFQVLRTQKRANPFRVLVTDGERAFEVLRGKVRERYLIEHGYDSEHKVRRRGLTLECSGPGTHLSGNPTNQELTVKACWT